MRRLLGLGLALGTVGGCTGASAFTCQGDAECGADGVCQTDGFCSFPSGDCESGHRYGEHSGAVAGQCVPVPPTTSGTGDAGSGSTTSTTTSTTTTSTSTSTSTSSTGSSDGGSDETGGEVDPDLVLWLQFEDPQQPGLDSSMWADDGVCAVGECPQIGPGRIGSGARFDGVDDVIVVEHGPRFETTEGITVAVWLRVADTPVVHEALVAKPFGASNFNAWELFFYPQTGLDHDSLRFFVLTDGLQYGSRYLEPVAGATWMHVAGVWDGQMTGVYVDGIPVGMAEMTSSIDLDEEPVYVGADDDHTGTLEAFLDGELDDVRVYARALTPSEIEALAAGG